jgi:hypothetical protein
MEERTARPDDAYAFSERPNEWQSNHQHDQRGTVFPAIARLLAYIE